VPAEEGHQRVLVERFELAEILGSGGMATVYRGWDREAGRPCAVKVLGDPLSRDEEFRRRFRREAEAAMGLVHPGIVTVYGYGDAGGHHYIAMEYVSGGTLRDLLERRGRLPEAEALRVAAEVADALAYAHRRGVVHRDIKPHNILLTPDGHVKVADFGIARTLDATYLTQTGTVMGSAHYLSPEQARGDQAGPGSDLYALGVVLYEMLAGRVPFDGEAPVAIALKHLHETPPDLGRVRPGLSRETQALVGRLLGKAPRERYASADALAADLRRIAAGLGGGAGAAGATQALPAAGVLSETQRLPAIDAPADSGPPGGGTGVLHPVSDTSRMQALPAAAPVWPAWARAAISLAVLAALAGLAVTIYRTTWAMTHVTVPPFVGRTVADAGKIALPLQIGVAVTARQQDPRAAVGVILGQDPPPGREVRKGTVVRLTVSQGSGLVPDVRGLAVTEAARRLEAAGLRLGQVSYTFAGLTPSGTVIQQFVAPGAHLAPNGPVDVLVSQGSMPFPLGTPWFVPTPGPGNRGSDYGGK
jgi:predicted Ser/Thr protein kinase